MAHQCGDLTFVDISINVRLEWCDLSVAHIIATVCLTEAVVLQHKPLTCDNTAALKKRAEARTNLDCRRQKFGPVYAPNIMQVKSTIFRCLKRLCKSDIVMVQNFLFL